MPSLLEIVEQKLIPWMMQDAEKRLIIAPPKLADAVPEEGFAFTPRKLKGKRVPRRGFSYSGIKARWAEDHLLETYNPLFFFVLDGEIDYCCSDYILHAPEGSAILVPAGIPRADGYEDLLELVGDNPKRFCNCMLFHERSGNLEIWLNHDRGNKHYRSLRSAQAFISNFQLSRMLTTAQDELLAGEENSLPIAVRHLEIFLYMLQRDLRNKKGFYPGRLDNMESQAIQNYDPIAWAQQYIREHLAEQLTIELVAREVRLSRTQFVKRFRLETGETFNGYVTRCRLEQAKHMLEDTTLTIRFISENLGYNSDVHFYRLFLKHEGFTPSAYRAQFQNSGR